MSAYMAAKHCPVEEGPPRLCVLKIQSEENSSMEEENEARVKPGNEGRRNVVIPRTTMEQRGTKGCEGPKGLAASYS